MVKNEVKKKVGNDYSVSVKCVLKINRELQALSILHNGSKYAPSIYLEDFFKEYKNGKAICDIASEIVMISKQRKKDTAFILENIRNFDWVKPKLRVKLINYQKNEKLLRTIPHEKYLDLAIIPYVLISKENGNLMTTRVLYSLIAQWNISEELLLKQAKDNTIQRSPVIIEKMADFILCAMLKEIEAESDSEELFRTILNKDSSRIEMYILTNENNLEGAFPAFNTDKLAELSDRIGIDKLYILPSSIHEIIAVPAVEINPDKLKEIVKEVNRTQVREEDFLSDAVYHYSRMSNQISIVV